MVKYTHFHFNDLNINQLYDLLKIRQEVFVVEQDCAYQDADDVDQKCLHVLGTYNKKLVATTRIVPKGISYPSYVSIGRVVNVSSIRGKGEGKRLMDYSIALCKEIYPNEKIKISAQVYLDKFYKELGFIAFGEEYLEDGIPHQSMIYSDKD